MKILVTGGLGYIGSHTVVELQEEGFEVVIIDDLSNTSKEVLKGIASITGKTPEFHQIDLKDKVTVDAFFDEYQDIKGVIHFAAYKAVGESVKDPIMYYENNLFSLINLLSNVTKFNISNFIFSSSCTVYGQSKEQPITESALILKAESPYGNTKQIGEEIIQDVCESNLNFSAISLRYFNPIGAHKSAKIGELPLGVPQNLVPYITQTAVGIRKQLQVYGDDYPTHDGTCIRDYIHVVDIAKAHVKAVQVLINKDLPNNYDFFNLGTGKGSSVLEVISTFEKVTDKPLNYKIAPRRSGDVISVFADTKKAKKILNWETKLSLEDALRSSWKWQKSL